MFTSCPCNDRDFMRGYNTGRMATETFLSVSWLITKMGRLRPPFSHALGVGWRYTVPV